jgi:alpha-mannosidase
MIMKKWSIINILLFLLLPELIFAVLNTENNLPGEIDYKVQPYYRRRADGKAGREVIIRFNEPKQLTGAKMEISSGNIHETISIEAEDQGSDSLTIILPPDIGVREDATVTMKLQDVSEEWNKTIQVPALRHWIVYVYPHSHVDIGYSNTHANVEFIHKRNIDEGIRLAKETEDYPDEAKYLWNTEVMWPVERYLSSSSPEKRGSILDAVRKNQVCLDAAYVHVNTSCCSGEELFQLFKHRREIEKLTGQPNDVMVQVDVPGMSWGIVPVLAQEGIRYIMMFPNGTRGNQEMTYRLNQKPFWWVGPDGRSKVLFLQPGSYAVGLGKGRTTGRPWFGERDTARIPKVVKTDNPRENFLDDHLFRALPELESKSHPYDIYVVTWAMWDNSIQDADLPEAVKSWNEDYAYPKLIISSGHEIMQNFEEKYGDDLPVVTGDYTEYWSDNMGVAARQTKMNKNAKERLLQAETVWTMLNHGRPAPRDEFDEAWRYIILGSEHTYAAENPYDPFFFEACWKVKKSYFREAEDRSIDLLNSALAPATDRSEGALGPVSGPSSGGVAVINTHSWSHGGIVSLNKLESQTGDRVIDDEENEVRSQRLSSGELVFLAEDVPAFGSRHYRVVPGKCSLPNSCSYEKGILDNGILQVRVNEKTGNVTGLTMNASGEDFADVGKGLNNFFWQPARGTGDAQTDSNIVITLKESGPLLTEVEISSLARGCRSVVRRVRLVHGQPWVEFCNTIDKLPLVEKDGIHFGYAFDIPGSKTRADIPWGVMELEKDQWPAANRAWIAAEHWVDISNESKGVTWCSLDAPLFESGSITANNTAGWDGKGDVWPRKLSPASTIYSWVMNNHWYTNTPQTQDGPVIFRYRVLPHGPFDSAKTDRFGLEQAQPLIPVLCDTDPLDDPLVFINSSRVNINMLKSMAGGRSVVFRLQSLSGRDENIALSWPHKEPVSVYICDKAEEPGDKITNGRILVPAMGIVTLYAEW